MRLQAFFLAFIFIVFLAIIKAQDDKNPAVLIKNITQIRQARLENGKKATFS